MLRVLRHHGIRVVPIDILPSSDGDAGGIGLIGVDIGAVRRAIGPRTVAILVTHPFGMICTSDEDMASVRSMATHHGLDLVEDCAECYAGGGGQNNSYGGGSEAADVCLYSFGTIKTATVSRRWYCYCSRAEPWRRNEAGTTLQRPTNEC